MGSKGSGIWTPKLVQKMDTVRIMIWQTMGKTVPTLTTVTTPTKPNIIPCTVTEFVVGRAVTRRAILTLISWHT